MQVKLKVPPTCQGYSLTSVSTPPTILVTLLAIPHIVDKIFEVVEDDDIVEDEIVVDEEGAKIDHTLHNLERYIKKQMAYN